MSSGPELRAGLLARCWRAAPLPPEVGHREWKTLCSESCIEAVESGLRV